MKHTLYNAYITSISHEGRGVARLNGKTTFIEGALLGENVRFSYKKQRGSFDEGVLVETITQSPDRVTPACLHYGVCGGCQFQHLNIAAQQSIKQQIFLEQL